MWVRFLLEGWSDQLGLVSSYSSLSIGYRVAGLWSQQGELRSRMTHWPLKNGFVDAYVCFYQERILSFPNNIPLNITLGQLGGVQN